MHQIHAIGVGVTLALHQLNTVGRLLFVAECIRDCKSQLLLCLAMQWEQWCFCMESLQFCLQRNSPDNDACVGGWLNPPGPNTRYANGSSLSGINGPLVYSNLVRSWWRPTWPKFPAIDLNDCCCYVSAHQDLFASYHEVFQIRVFVPNLWALWYSGISF